MYSPNFDPKFTEGYVYLFITKESFTFRNCVVVDNFGANLTPAEIRSRLDDYSLMASNLRAVFVVLSTNTIALNCFGPDDLDRVYVFDSGIYGNMQGENKWVPVNRIHDPGKLAIFSLGELYNREML